MSDSEPEKDHEEGEEASTEEELATSSGQHTPACARRRFGPFPIPEIVTIEEAEAFVLFGIITGNEAAILVVTDSILAESVGEAGINILKDLAIKAIGDGGIALETIISQFVGLYSIFLYKFLFEEIIFQELVGQGRALLKGWRN